jgi:mannitol-1-/sugar-/sorbitol-6-phosphatase
MSVEVPFDGLLFDADGVLVDSDASVELSWGRWARRWRLDPAVVMALVHGRRSADTVSLLVDESHWEQALADIDRFEVEDAARVHACPGAAELLRERLGRWAVVTSARRELVEARMAAAGLVAPPVLVSAGDVEHGKPDPAGYLLAADTLGVPPTACVVLEDSPTGIAAGLAAGAVVVGVSERALGSGAAVVVKSLAGLTVSCGALRIPDEAAL